MMVVEIKVQTKVRMIFKNTNQKLLLPNTGTISRVIRCKRVKGSTKLPDLMCRRKVIGGKQESVDATLGEGITAKTLIR